MSHGEKIFLFVSNNLEQWIATLLLEKDIILMQLNPVISNSQETGKYVWNSKSSKQLIVNDWRANPREIAYSK